MNLEINLKSSKQNSDLLLINMIYWHCAAFMFKVILKMADVLRYDQSDSQCSHQSSFHLCREYVTYIVLSFIILYKSVIFGFFRSDLIPRVGSVTLFSAPALSPLLLTMFVVLIDEEIDRTLRSFSSQRKTQNAEHQLGCLVHRSTCNLGLRHFMKDIIHG